MNIEPKDAARIVAALEVARGMKLAEIAILQAQGSHDIPERVALCREVVRIQRLRDRVAELIP